MARQTKSEDESTLSPPPMAALMGSNGETIETAFESQRALWDSMAELGQEMMEFMNHRLQEDMETSRALMTCKTPEEAFRLQCRFAETATREYFAEAQKVMELAAKVAHAGWRPVEQRTEKALKDMAGSTD